MTTNDEHILSEFWKTLRKNAGEGVVDIDNSFQHKFGYSVQRFEEVLKGTNRSVPPNRWSYHRIGLVKKGSGEFVTGMYNFKAPANTLVAVPARMITSSKNWTMDLETYIAVFNPDFLIAHHFPPQILESRKILSGFYQPFVHLHKEETEKISNLFEAILKEKASENPLKNELIALKLVELILLSEQYFTEHLHLTEDIPNLELIKKFSDLIEKYFMQERSVKFYAGQLNMHPNHLNAVVKKHTGLTAKASIQNRLLLETKYLLHSTHLSIKEISAKMGFTDPNYFTSFFTQLENMSPGNYRASFT
jgi:AraC family transcriptional regulator, transcriptional activator of pobA